MAGGEGERVDAPRSPRQATGRSRPPPQNTTIKLWKTCGGRREALAAMTTMWRGSGNDGATCHQGEPWQSRRERGGDTTMDDGRWTHCIRRTTTTTTTILHNNQIMPTSGCGASARRQQRDDGGGTILPRGHGCAMNTGEDTGGEEGEAERLRSKRTARQEKVPRGGEEEGDGHSGDGR